MGSKPSTQETRPARKRDAAPAGGAVPVVLETAGLEDLPDATLIGRCLADADDGCYAALMARYQDRAYWTAYRLVQNNEDAADVTQEAFVKAFTMLRTFDVKRAFFTWMYRIVTNVAIDFLRRKDARPQSPLDEFGEFVPDARTEAPESAVTRHETRNEVHEALHLLAEPYRSVLVLRELEGLTCKEIGELIDVPHATVRWRLHHARQMFKDVWERLVLHGPAEAEA